MTNAIVFDLFGVIALPQSEPDKRRIEAIAGVPADAFWEAYWALRKPYDAGQLSVDYWLAVADRLGVRFEAATIGSLIEADLASWTEVDPVMVELIRDLAARGRTLGMLSNIIADLVPIFEAKHGDWLAHFTARTYSCDIGVAKPDHRAFESAAEQLHTTPANCLFYDDTPANVRAARETGMTAHHFTTPNQIRALL